MTNKAKQSGAQLRSNLHISLNATLVMSAGGWQTA
jgi:hypothetical protein